MKKVIFTLTVILLLVVFGVSAFYVGSYVLDGKKQADQYNDLADIASGSQTVPTTAAPVETKPAETTAATETTAAGDPVMLPGYAEIYEKNTDAVGWIRIANTKIDYPVLQTPDDPNFYLYRDFYKADSQRGAIYAWGDADVNRPSDNITMFGHHMKDGSMFAALNAYTSKTAWDNNNLIFFDTLYEYHTYQIFAAFRTSANVGEGFSYHQFVDAENEAEFNEFIETCKQLSYYDTGITPKYGDKIICLSTCEYTLDNGRLVVAAVRIS